MTRRLALTLILAVSSFLACGDDDPATTPTAPGGSSLTGSWRVTSSLVLPPESARGGDPGIGNPEVIQFNADNTYALLQTRSGEFRDRAQGVFIVAGGQIDFGDDIFNYSIAGSDLTLTSPDRTISATLDPTAPTADEWILPATVVAEMDSPFNEDSDLAWNGSTLWLGNGRESDEIYEIDSEALTVLSMLPTNREGWAIEWHNGELWVSHDGSESIFRLNTTTGDSEFTSLNMGAWIAGIASDGDDLWCFSNNEDTIYQYDPDTDTILSTIVFDGFIGPEGMAFVDGFLYIAALDVVHQCEVDPFSVVGAFGVPEREIVGVTHDGTDFWVHSLSRDFDDGKIQKVEF